MIELLSFLCLFHFLSAHFTLKVCIVYIHPTILQPTLTITLERSYSAATSSGITLYPICTMNHIPRVYHDSRLSNDELTGSHLHIWPVFRRCPQDKLSLGTMDPTVGTWQKDLTQVNG
jgi:hypothetical protein